MRTVLLLSFFGLSLLACGTGGTGGTPDAASKPTCTMITERCHDLDPGMGPIHECHEFSEAASTTEAQCMTRRAECFATCTAASTDGGASEAGTTDASASGG